MAIVLTDNEKQVARQVLASFLDGTRIITGGRDRQTLERVIAKLDIELRKHNK